MSDQRRKEIMALLAAGKLTPEEATRMAAEETPFRSLSEISLDALRVDVLPCGFPSLDACQVFKRGAGEMVVVAARPGHGKSAFIFQIAAYVSKSAPVLIFSVEMSLVAIKQRMMAAITGIGLKRVQTLDAPQAKLEAGNRELDKLQFTVVDEKGLDARTLCAYARGWARNNPGGLVVVDYLQIVNTPQMRSRTEEVATASRALCALAQELKMPVLVAAQASRECERRGRDSGDYLPGMSDMAESSQIEKDADTIIALSREEKYNGSRPGIADVAIVKQRMGEAGRFEFKFLGASCRFLDPQEDCPI